MKYNIDVPQKAAFDAGLLGKVDAIDLMVFDAFKDFANSGRCEKRFELGRVWFWISYTLVVEELPFAGLTKKDSVYRRMKNLREAGIIVFHPNAARLGKSFFSWGPVYDALITTTKHPATPGRKSEGTPPPAPPPPDQRPTPPGPLSVPPPDNHPDNHTTIDQGTKPPVKTLGGLYPPGGQDQGGGELNGKKNHLGGGDASNGAAEKPKPLRPGERQLLTHGENIRRVVEYLNQVCGRKFAYTQLDAVRCIAGWLEKGYTVEQFEQVVDNRWVKWGTRPDMAEFLRPITLFGSKFEAYYNAAAATLVTTTNGAPSDRLPGEDDVSYLRRTGGYQH